MQGERKRKIPKARLNFVRYYIEQDFQNATRAYLRAYPNANEATARRNASLLLTKTYIQELVSTELAAVIEKSRIPLEKRILEVWVKRAFYDPTEIIDLTGQLVITTEELRSKGLEVCIDAINEKLNAQGERYIEYKLADRDKALNMLQQYIQMIEEPKKRIEVSTISIGLPPKPEDIVVEGFAGQEGADA